MLLTSLYFSRGDRSPLDTPSVPEKPPGIPPSPLHGRGGSGHVSRGSGVKVRRSWTFTENFMRRSAERLPCLFCLRQKTAGDCAPQGREKARFCVPFLTFCSGIYGFYG